MHAQPSQIRAYAAGELDPKARRSIERHVHRCLLCWDHLQAASSREVSAWDPELEYSRPQLNAQTLLGASLAENRQAELNTPTRFGPWIPTVALLGVMVILGAFVGLVWSLGGSSAVAATQQDPTGSWSAKATKLSTDDLNGLRAAGWNCPVVEAAGFELASATGIRTAEKAQVDIVLKRNASEVTLTESRELPGNIFSTEKLATADSPVTKKSGNEVVDAAMSELGRRLGASAGATVDFARGTATLSMDQVKYTITSNLSKKDLESLMQRLVIGEHAHFGSFDTDSDQVGERLLRGLSKLLVLDLN
ncbi:hypothetical protein CQ018_01335 [Arthrobacter sp. MYb227]|uniref:hypothetical protein n=1 Tax=Arthrobacter sp. MYb227 TaxID=1848601 RepID=UPI000CFD10E9|nr:hypothetical protein [Arthrobacter sp. MYb227]PQZ95961.1 hypothetical protein CQ018_01335 [Arthrobacter sp. MYb227]